jgi:orotate phosphoribosyltransferase
MQQSEILNIFKETGALLEGHFILRSGLRSANFFQCATVCQYLDKVTLLAEALVSKCKELGYNTVVAPAMGGLVIGQEVARQSGVRFIFVEKMDDKLVMRRGFKLNKTDKVLIVEDVVTRGGRVREALDIVKGTEAEVVGVAVLVDRSEGKTSFEVPMISLVELSFPTYEPENIPDELKSIPAIKPGS